MALLGCLRNVGRQTSSYNQIYRLPYLHSRCIILKASPVQPTVDLDHDKKNAKLGRPMSPHLTIYKFQLPAVMSISHRITGMVLSGYAVLLAGGSFLSSDIAQVATIMQGWQLPIILTFPLKLIIGFPAAYHLFNGIRHLVWDTGRALTMKEVYITGYGVLFASALLAVYMAS